MPADPEHRAASHLRDLRARHGWPGPDDPNDVHRLATLIRQAVAEERNACAEIAEDMMRLCGSHAAEQVAARIRARDLEAGGQP